jgi:thiol-disulfide isomerase/thioredoxin
MAARALAAAAALAAAGASAPDGPALQPWTRGETPALAGRDPAGRPVELAALRGRAVLVAFWASWCEPCAEELPALARLRDRLRGRPFELLTVNLGEAPARVEAFQRERGVALPVLLDRDLEAAAAWGVGGLPMAFLVDADGRVRASLFGLADWADGAPGRALEQLVAEVEATGPRRSR